MNMYVQKLLKFHKSFLIYQVFLWCKEEAMTNNFKAFSILHDILQLPMSQIQLKKNNLRGWYSVGDVLCCIYIKYSYWNYGWKLFFFPSDCSTFSYYILARLIFLWRIRFCFLTQLFSTDICLLWFWLTPSLNHIVYAVQLISLYLLRADTFLQYFWSF